MNTEKPTTHIWLGALVCALYVLLGAFGAHSLKSTLTASQLDIYETGLKYMVIHGLALILTNTAYIVLHKYNRWSNFMTYCGIILFSFSLIIHATKDLAHISTNFFAILAPFGGLSFIAGWLIFTYSIRKK
ncbi:MAG: hypothetical protein COA58_00910 [Bacteroidetes bacterium]|nr:MAG: hypothetical protein COA58_00910 [Bacteroidota bacterium]